MNLKHRLPLTNMYDKIRSGINWQQLVQDVKDINGTDAFKGGGSANFIKEPYLNLAIETNSNDLVFVDKKDYDFTSPIGTIENKSQKNLMYTIGGKNGKPLQRDICANFTFKNKNTKHKIGLNKKFDHLMLTQTSGQFVIGMISYSDVTKYLQDEEDKWIITGLPVKEIDILYSENMKTNVNFEPFAGLHEIIRVQLNERHK